MWEALALVGGIAIGRFSAPMFRKPRLVVEDFKIEQTTNEGLPCLLLKLQDESRKITTYEFHPAHARNLSDALLREAARSVAPTAKGE